MKKLNFIVIALVSVVLTACGGGGTLSPKAFNETAMNIFKAANTSLSEFDAKITEGVKSNDLASIATAAESALSKVEPQIEKMKGLAIPEGGEKYKESVLKSLETLKSIIETGKKYAALPEGYARSEFNALEREYNDKRKQLSTQLQDVAKAQTEFAKAVGGLK